MNDREFCARVRIEAEAIERWVIAGWLAPDQRTGTSHYSDIDLARARLIQDLTHGAGVNDEGVDVILHLVDQLHGIRRTMHDLLAALRAQPDDLREQLAKALAAIDGHSSEDRSIE